MNRSPTIVIILTFGLAMPLLANPIAGCGWDSTDITVLGMSGPGDPPVIASFVTEGPYVIGARTLQLVNNSPNGIARAYLAYGYHPSEMPGIWALFMVRHPETTGPPLVNVRLRYDDSLPEDLDADDGEAYRADIFAGIEWSSVELHTDGDPAHTGVVLEIEFAGMPGDVIWIEDMYFQPEGSATIVTPCEDVNPVQPSTLSTVKGLFR